MPFAPAIGIIVMSLGLLHSHLPLAMGFGQVRDASRSLADAARHFMDIVFHLQEVHLAQSTLLFALLLQRLSR
jgi:hypothetical protein